MPRSRRRVRGKKRKEIEKEKERVCPHVVRR